MSGSKWTCTAVLCGIAFLAAPLVASARPKTEDRPTKKSMQLDNQVTVDGETLLPGNYEVLINGNKVSFELAGKIVATAPCSWKTMSNKSMYDSTTLSATNNLQEMEFAGSNQALEVF